MDDRCFQEWMGEIRRGEEAATESLWRAFFDRLVTYARTRLPPHAQREFDAEDVALSALDSLCRGAQKGRFLELEHTENLWALLVVITARKAQRRIRHQSALKRGGGMLQGESALDHRADAASPGGGLRDIIGREPTPAFTCEVLEESEHLLAALPDDALRMVARLKLEGYSNQEIAGRMGCAKRTVIRRSHLIRTIWSAKFQTNGSDRPECL